MISVKNISKKYKLGSEEIDAIKSISLDFNEGKMYAIMGHSGSGKSTLLHILGLLDSPTTGDVYINNINIKKLSEKQLSSIRANNIGFVFQSFYLNPNMTAYENVMLPMYIGKNKLANKKNKALKLLEQVGVKGIAKHYPKQLSGGEQQRVAIARALANNPEFIIADEPTGNLDKDNELAIFALLRKICKEEKKCVIIATHNNIIKKYADEIINIDFGKVK